VTLLLMCLCALVAALAVGGAGCTTAATSTSTSGLTSMKGWELYSWQADGRWCYSLLVGPTVPSPRRRSRRRAPSWTVWTRCAPRSGPRTGPAGHVVAPTLGRRRAGLSPADVVADVRRTCAERGLELYVAEDGR